MRIAESMEQYHCLIRKFLVADKDLEIAEAEADRLSESIAATRSDLGRDLRTKRFGTVQAKQGRLEQAVGDICRQLDELRSKDAALPGLQDNAQLAHFRRQLVDCRMELDRLEDAHRKSHFAQMAPNRPARISYLTEQAAWLTKRIRTLEAARASLATEAERA